MNRPASLCPGYIHVDAFNDEEYEEEVMYVTVDLENIEPSLIPSSDSYRLIGLDTKTPFLQLSGTLLKGTHEWMMGSEMVFAQCGGGPAAPEDESANAIEYVANSDQRVIFREVRLEAKKAEPTEPVPPVPIPIDPSLLSGTAEEPPAKRTRTKRKSTKAAAENDEDAEGDDDDDYAEVRRGRGRGRGRGRKTRAA